MHSLIVIGLRSYFTEVHGADIWAQIAASEGYAPDDFELSIVKSKTLPHRFLRKGSALLERSQPDLLEDFGLYLTTHPTTTSMRRLMRFSGPDFNEFVVSLPDLSPRVLMAVPGLVLPRIDVGDIENGYEIAIRETVDGYDHVIAGIIRGMADDYGVLAHVEPTQCRVNANRPDYTYWAVTILDEGFSDGRAFSLVEAE